MLKVVDSDDSLSSFTCQYPLWQSTLVKTFALARSGSTSSMFGMGWRYLFRCLFSGRGSRLSLILQLLFLAKTIALTQSVGCSTLSITPFFSKSAKWSFNGCLRASGIFHGGSWTSLAHSSTSRCSSAPRFPSPSNTSLYLVVISCKVIPILSGGSWS